MNAARVGDLVASGPPVPINGVVQTSVRSGGIPLVVVGAAVADHGSGAHDAASMAAGSAAVRVGGIPVCRTGDAASCGHVVALGSSHITITA